MQARSTVGAFAIVRDERGRVLLCHRRDRDAWNLPGGAVDSGELPTEAVARGVREETGLDVEVGELVGVCGKDYRDEIVFAFRCRVTGGALSESDETDACACFDPAALPANTFPSHAARIADALGHGPRPIFRLQRRSPGGR